MGNEYFGIMRRYLILHSQQHWLLSDDWECTLNRLENKESDK